MVTNISGNVSSFNITIKVAANGRPDKRMVPRPL
jgi:hypothetical protein